MAAYINETILAAYMGQGVVDGIATNEGFDLSVVIADASDLVGSYLRNSGYTVPSTEVPSEIEDATVRLATVAIVWESIAAMPESSLKLPEGWKTHPAVLARDGILSGSATLSLALDTGSSVGGMLASATTGTNARPQRSSRTELAGY